MKEWMAQLINDYPWVGDVAAAIVSANTALTTFFPIIGTVGILTMLGIVVLQYRNSRKAAWEKRMADRGESVKHMIGEGFFDMLFELYYKDKISREEFHSWQKRVGYYFQLPDLLRRKPPSHIATKLRMAKEKMETKDVKPNIPGPKPGEGTNVVKLEEVKAKKIKFSKSA